MNYLTYQLLNPELIKILKTALINKDSLWEDGKKTAGNHAAKVKNNLQLNRNSEISQKYSKLISKKILSEPLIKSFCLPKNIHGTMFTKSLKGMKYGRHIDNAFMSSGRADLSFTLFLNKKNEYEGGELLIENINSEEKLKLNAGEIIISKYIPSLSRRSTTRGKISICWLDRKLCKEYRRKRIFI